MPEVRPLLGNQTFVCVFWGGGLDSLQRSVHRRRVSSLYTFLSFLISSKIQLPRFALKGEKIIWHSL